MRSVQNPKLVCPFWSILHKYLQYGYFPSSLLWGLLKRYIVYKEEIRVYCREHFYIPYYFLLGECLLENMRTLCVACHSDVTAAQCAERRTERVKARRQLKAILKALKNDDNTEVPEAKAKVYI